MQALLRAASGTCFSKSALKGTRVHQQGAVASAPTLRVAMAQALGCPHKGQRQGSMARGAVMTTDSQFQMGVTRQSSASRPPQNTIFNHAQQNGSRRSRFQVSDRVRRQRVQAALTFKRQACSSGSV
jgi:hypothetical protein